MNTGNMMQGTGTMNVNNPMGGKMNPGSMMNTNNQMVSQMNMVSPNMGNTANQMQQLQQVSSSNSIKIMIFIV